MNIKKLISSFLLVFCFSGCANQKMTQIESLEPGNLSGVNLFCEEQDLFNTYDKVMIYYLKDLTFTNKSHATCLTYGSKKIVDQAY